jgi:hypothetical protein
VDGAELKNPLHPGMNGPSGVVGVIQALQAIARDLANDQRDIVGD